MDYQAIRAKFEVGIQSAFSALSPSVPVYFDNTLNSLSDAESEFVFVNLQFGLTTEPALSTQHDYVRGTIVIRVYSEKGVGPSRNQTLTNTAFTALQTLDNTDKTNSGVYIRIGAIDGPAFGTGSTDQESRIAFTPYFISRIDTTFTAQVIS